MRINPYKPLPHDVTRAMPNALPNPLVHIRDVRVLDVVRDDLMIYVDTLRANLAHSPDGMAALDGVTDRLDAWIEDAHERAESARDAAEAGCFRLAMRAAKWWLWGRWR